jgi:hypothetical protein
LTDHHLSDRSAVADALSPTSARHFQIPSRYKAVYRHSLVAERQLNGRAHIRIERSAVLAYRQKRAQWKSKVESAKKMLSEGKASRQVARALGLKADTALKIAKRMKRQRAADKSNGKENVDGMGDSDLSVR